MPLTGAATAAPFLSAPANLQPPMTVNRTVSRISRHQFRLCYWLRHLCAVCLVVTMSTSSSNLPPIPAKRYFTIGEVAELCGVKPHVLRYWEQEFTQLTPMKRRGNRRYYQHHEVLMVRRIRDLLYEQGFTISGARHQLEAGKGKTIPAGPAPAAPEAAASKPAAELTPIQDVATLRRELEAILTFLS